MPPVQTIHEARAHATFDALMRALSYPGRPQTLKLEDGRTGFMAIAEALLDLEATAFSTEQSLEKDLHATGAKLVPLERAEYVFIPRLTEVELPLLQRVNRGSTLTPDDAATLVIGATFSQEVLESAQPLRLRGPGIQDSLEINIGNLPPDFWRVREEIIAFPVGWDVFFVSGNQILGLPRTTAVALKIAEVL
jgi:alpha-D-ribose 1-methylphosphonate 5-triphosphate synthase subunit PhnH